MSRAENDENVPRNKGKFCLLLCAAVPFALKFVYLNRAWVSSPVDRARMGLWGTAALLVVVVAMLAKFVKRFPTEKPLTQSRALRVLPISLLAYGFGIVLDLNALQLVASIGILWAAAWMLYGRVSGLMLAPAVLFAVLAVPGSSYWLGQAASVFTAPVTAAYVPTFDIRSQRGFLGREVPPSDGFRRFFRTSEAHDYRFASTNSVVSLLTVRIGGDIHEIHPATHCLRSTGWHVDSERLRYVLIPNRTEPLSVTEAIVSKGPETRRVMWVWYSTAQASTGGFIRFRRLYSKDETWWTYQLTTDVPPDGDIEAARRHLTEFLAAGDLPR